MSYGLDIGGVRRTRTYTGEANAGFGGEVKKSRAEVAPVTIKVEATLHNGTYDLVVTAEGETASRSGVRPADLADTLASIIGRLSKAVADGDLKKHRAPEPAVRMGSAHNWTRKSKRDVFSG